jgi:hypothetical protein
MKPVAGDGQGGLDDIIILFVYAEWTSANYRCDDAKGKMKLIII